MISTSRTSDFQISGSAISSHKNIQKELIFNKIELMDMEKLYRAVVLSGKKNFEDYVDACIRCWYNRAQMRQINMFEV